MEDPLLIKVVRVEEGMVRVHDRITANHKEVVNFMTRMEPALARAEENHIKIARMEVSHRWLYVIATIMMPAAVTVLEMYLHYFNHV